MMKTKIDFITENDLTLAANAARDEYMTLFDKNMPFNTELFLETSHQMVIIPVPKLKDLGIECSISRDGKTILVDKTSYDSPAGDNRLRFTLAHELAHKLLHSKYLPLIDTIDSSDKKKIETQASMFAARYLMPEHLVLGVIATEILSRIEGILSSDLTLEACVNFRIKEIADYFGVSVQAMENRIRNIDLSKVLSGPYISHSDIETLTRLSKNGLPESSSLQYTPRTN